MTKNNFAVGFYWSAGVAVLVLLAGCSAQSVKLIHPQSGATAECSASGFGVGVSIADGIVGGCRRAYEERGYVPIERLDADDRASLERRGLFPQK